MKKLLVLTCALLVVSLSFAYTPSTIDEKLLNAFNNSFPRAEKVSWQEASKSYIVSFVDNGIRSRITYYKDGTIMSYIRYYFEETLPVNVRMAVKEEFPGKKVWGVVEISSLPDTRGARGDKGLETIYYIKLEGPSTWTTVKMDSNGNWDVTERYRKAL